LSDNILETVVQFCYYLSFLYSKENIEEKFDNLAKTLVQTHGIEK